VTIDRDEDREDEKLLVEITRENQRLLKKLNQLSTTIIIEVPSIATGKQRSSSTPKNSPRLLVTTTTTTVTATKGMKTGHENDDDDNGNTNKNMSSDRIPTYLAGKNPAFERQMNSLIQQSLSLVNLEQLSYDKLLSSCTNQQE
jgi:hypothetical protein